MDAKLSAGTYGIGQLITQRKAFVVPLHQRLFAWSPEQIEQYLDDVDAAIQSQTPEYFIGVIVLRGPVDTSWEVLDGQQRLATTTMIYSAIRDWLRENNYPEDARQIENEFIGVRQLGGTYSARLKLNSTNRSLFDRFIVQGASTTDVRTELESHRRTSSNYYLLKGVQYCRQWLEKYTGSDATRHQKAARIFALASFLENRVMVVGVDVRSTADAYILFEALNDRGAELSALDLVKNYIFSKVPAGRSEEYDARWSRLSDNIEGRGADDFLKVFWTSRFGIVHKSNIFAKISEEYRSDVDGSQLLTQLVEGSERYAALEDPEHRVWAAYDWTSRYLIEDLKTLGNRQARPLILAALEHFAHEEVCPFLWLLIVVVVRFQVAGGGRTGVMEKAFASLAKRIQSGEVCTADAAYHHLRSLITDDAAFVSDFRQIKERKAARIFYLLREMEAASRDEHVSGRMYLEHRARSAAYSPSYATRRLPESLWVEIGDSIGNRVLRFDAPRVSTLAFSSSDYVSDDSWTLDAATIDQDWGRLHHPDELAQLIEHRATALAELAVRTWRFPRQPFCGYVG